MAENPFEIEPLNFDLADQQGEGIEPAHNPVAQKLGFGDFPSLRDLETSNAYTKSNLAVQRKSL